MRYASLITQGLCQWLPDFWALTQQRLPALAAAAEGEGGGVEAAAAVERGIAAAQRSVAILLELYRSAVLNLLASPAAAGLTHAGLLSVAAELANGCSLLQAGLTSGGGGAAAAVSEGHPAALDLLRLLAERALQASLQQLAEHLHAEVAQACRAEGYWLTADSRRAGRPSTASVAALKALVQQGMHHLQAALAEADRAGVSLQAKAAAAARDAFFGCFSAFAAGVDSLAQGLLTGANQQQQPGHAPSLAAAAAAAAAFASAAAGGGSGGRDGPPASLAHRLLVLCANLGAARGQLLPQQYARWAALLQAAGSSGKELQSAAQACAAELDAVETRLAGAYIDRKQVGGSTWAAGWLQGAGGAAASNASALSSSPTANLPYLPPSGGRPYWMKPWSSCCSPGGQPGRWRRRRGPCARRSWSSSTPWWPHRQALWPHVRLEHEPNQSQPKPNLSSMSLTRLGGGASQAASGRLPARFGAQPWAGPPQPRATCAASNRPAGSAARCPAGRAGGHGAGAAV